jgi:sugar lactone lactonase YvrE
MSRSLVNLATRRTNARRQPRLRWQTAAWLMAALSACGEPAASDPCADLASGQICTVAGTGVKGMRGDGGPARQAWLWTPWGLTTDAEGTVYVTDWNNHAVRRLRGNGTTRTIDTIIGTEGPGDGEPDGLEFQPGGADGLTVSLNHPTDMMFAAQDTPVARKGQMLLTAWHNHRLRTWDPATGKVMVTCGKDPGYNGDGSPLGKPTQLNQPSHTVQDKAGNTYIVDMRNWVIRKIGADGMVSTVAGRWGKPGGSEAVDGAPTPAKDAQFLFFDPSEWSNPYFAGGGLAVSADGRQLYVADTGNHRIRKLDLEAGTIETIAGSGANGCVGLAGEATACKNDAKFPPRSGGFAGDGGPAKAARLNQPVDLAWGPDGRLYFADSGNDRVRAIDLQTGVIRTVAGGGKGSGDDTVTGNVMKPLADSQIGDGSAATQATLNRPRSIHFDAAGNLWIADSYNNRVRMVRK